MSKNTGSIAILGGMGPQASAKLLEVIVSMAAEDFDAHEDTDFPEVIIDSVPVPNFISSKKNLNRARDILSSRVKVLQNFKPSFFAIACNTAHVLLPDLQAGTKVPFVSIIEEVAQKVAETGIKKVGLLATSVTIGSGLYKKTLENKKIETIVPTTSEVEAVEGIIRNVLSGSTSSVDRQKLASIAQSLRRRGARGIILGCTELPLIFPKDFDLPVFDSIEILARELLIKSFAKKGYV